MNRDRYMWLRWTLPPAILVALLWLPFGFTLHGLIEEWGVLGLFTNSGPLLFVTDGSGFGAHKLRPLTIFPHALAYLMQPDSFTAWHWIMIAALVAKGAASSYIGAYITRSTRWGVCFGLMVLLYPADTMQLSFRGLHINASLALMLFGSALFIWAQGSRSTGARWSAIVLGVVCLIAAQMMYEVAFALAPLPLVAIWCREGFRSTANQVRSRPAATGGWILASLLYAGYVLVASSSGGESYQQSLTSGRSPLAILWDALPKLFEVGMARALVGGWYDAWGMAASEFKSLLYVVVVGVLCTVLIVACRPFDVGGRGTLEADALTNEVTLWLRMVLAGLVLFVLGYGPYLLSPPHVAISQRTYLFATPGAALVILALPIALARMWKPIAAATVLGLFTLGAAAQLFQFHHYVTLSEMQRKVLRAIVSNFDGNTDGKSLLILDHSGRLSHTWSLRDNLQPALTYLYGRRVPVAEICLMPSGERQVIDALARPGRCIEEEDRWVFADSEPLPDVDVARRPDRIIKKTELMALTIEVDGSVRSDATLDSYRAQLASADTPAARRYRDILNATPQGWDLGLFEPAESRSSYRWDFGRWWSLEIPTHGNGWREAEWNIGWLEHDAVAWKIRENASLVFELKPDASPYVLEGRFTVIVNPAIKDSIKLLMNSVDLPIQWQSDGSFAANIPTGVLRNGLNTLEINSKVERSYYGLSAQLTMFQVRPTTPLR